MSKQIYPWQRVPNGRNFVPAECASRVHKFLWGFDIDQQNPCLLYRLDKTSGANKSLPKLQGIEIFYRDKGEDSYLIFCLVDRSYEDIFHQFGQMLICCINDKVSTESAAKILISRCWRWHTFLHSKNSKCLTLVQQQGLFAELTELQI